MRGVLDHLGVRYRHPRWGWQPVRCPNEDGHRHGDRNPSASVNIPLGRFYCHACLLHGDGFDLMMTLEHKDAQATMTALGIAPGKEESEWLI